MRSLNLPLGRVMPWYLATHDAQPQQFSLFIQPRRRKVLRSPYPGSRIAPVQHLWPSSPSSRPFYLLTSFGVGGSLLRYGVPGSASFLLTSPPGPGASCSHTRCSPPALFTAPIHPTSEKCYSPTLAFESAQAPRPPAHPIRASRAYEREERLLGKGVNQLDFTTRRHGRGNDDRLRRRCRRRTDSRREYRRCVRRHHR
jgi:hypothetical protein